MIETTEPPKTFTKENVIYWSNTYKQLLQLKENGVYDTYNILHKAKSFLKNDCIDYVRKGEGEDGGGYYICKPLQGYNKTTYKIKNVNGHFECDCQFYQNVVKKDKPFLVCSHILALKLQLKVWNSQKLENLK